MELFPHLKENQYIELINKFKKKPEKFSDFNSIFFQNKCYFFEEIEKNYTKEGVDFLNVYEHLQNLVLNIKEIFKEEIKILETGEKEAKVELTRKEAALIFLLSFFKCLIETSNTRFRVYNILISRSKTKFQFGRCFLNYLTIIGKWLKEKNSILDEKITYIRINIDENSVPFSEEEVNLCEIELKEEGSLFDGESQYCVDFANKFIGGGTLTGGCVQEEILFAVEPEAIVSMNFMEVMDKNDAIGIFNTIEYSRYKGYGSSFKFEKSSITNDLTKIKRHRIIAIDATVSRGFFFNNPQKDIMRDIHKAYVGFNLINLESQKDVEKTISTGNWGCGVFGGNHELKFLQQWIAASFAGVKKLFYFTFNNEKMKNSVKYYKDIKAKFQKANLLYEEIVFKKLDENKIIINLIKDNENKK